MAEQNGITVKIGAETDGIEQGIRQIQTSLKNIEGAGQSAASEFGSSFAKMAGAVAVGELAVKAFTGVFNAALNAARDVARGFGDALDLGGRLSDLSASTGETAGNLLLLERAFDTSGAGAEKVGPAIAKMQKSIQDASEGSLEAVQSLGLMGVSVGELEGKLPTEQLKVLASGINSIDDPTQRAAAAMGIFGKSGADLIPLLTNLDAEMADATATVGSMADIMNRRNSVFDAVADRFKIIQEKVRDFAAGILDKAIPAIDAITSALSRIDAAAIGQKLADAFLGGQDAMKGFQASVDAIKVGNISAAFSIFWDSLKLQAAQTANEIYKRLIAAFQSAGQFLGEIFSPSGALIQTAISAFEMFGKRVASSIQRDLATTFEALPNGLGESVALALNDMANQSNTAANKIEDDLKGASGRIGEQFTQAGAALPKSFEENYAKVPPLFDDLSKLQKSVEEQEKAIKKTVEETNAERAAGNEATEAELARRAEIRAAAEAAAAADQAARTELITLETALNEAKAAGNEELTKSLKKELESKKAKEEIKKLTEEYVKTLGLDANEAGRLATNFVNAKNAANSIGDRSVTVTVTTKVDDSAWKGLLAELAANADPKTVAVALKVTGQSDLQSAYATLQDMETAQKNFSVALETTGLKSLEEARQNLENIPTESQKQLAMQITGENDVDRAIQKLGTMAGSTTKAKLLLEKAGFENAEQLQNILNGIPDEKRAKVIAEAFGLEDVQSAVTAIDRLIANDGKKSSVNVDADVTAAENKVESVGKDPKTVKINADTAPAAAAIKKLADPITVQIKLDTSQVAAELAQMQLDIQNSFTGGQGGSGGTGGQGGQGGSGGNASANIGTLQSVVEAIAKIVAKIEPKLPQHALV